MSMTFDEILAEIIRLLQRQGRISYGALRRRFALDEAYLQDLKDELIDAQELAVDKDGKMLVWTGGTPVASAESPVPTSTQHPAPNSQPPIAYTPPHLAERIRAVNISDGERKTITALFADLKGSTALIEGLDPEEARAIIDPALQLMMDAVHRYEGYVAQALGDGIFALFGAPIAHEDHPQRALYAALRMQDEMRRYADTLREKGYPPLLLRVGVNTGEVVLRSIRKDDLHADYVPVGHSTNLAARMEQLAAPGSILVTAYTHKLTDGYFAFKTLGRTQIKGVEERLAIYEVLGTGPLRTRLQVTAIRRGLTRFVGRQRELEQLQHALAQAQVGHGQIVGVMGEPGVGKSRLFHEFVGAYSNTPRRVHGGLVLSASSVSHGKASPYLPVIELLKNYFDISAGDEERKRREKVGGKVLMLDRSLEDTLPYFFSLLGIEEQTSPLQRMDPQIRRDRTLTAVKKLFLRESLNQPLLLLFEDLHWIDSETQGVLDVLSESMASARILLLTNYRPEYRHEWGSKTYYTQLRLVPFGEAEAEEFLEVLLGTTGEAGQTPSLQALKQQILKKTEGSPFFMEEVVQTLVEDGTLSGEHGHYQLAPHASTHQAFTLHLPLTVQGILAARIDRLTPDEKVFLQQLAVIGREFSLELVRQILAQPDEDFSRMLTALQHKEFLYEQPAFPEVQYIFKHALTQEVAYNSVLIKRRKVLHEQAGQTIERLFSDRLEEHYGELAHHYSRSGNGEKAIEYLHKAGQQAAQNSAHTEAISHFTTALDLLKTLPDTSQRGQRELSLQLTLAASLQVTKGPSAPEVGIAYVRARVLCQHEGDERQLFAVLRGLWLLHHVRADLAAAREAGEQLLSMAERMQDSAMLLEARRTLGSTLLWQGEFSLAHIHLAQAVTLYDQGQHDSLKSLYGGADPGIVCLCELSRVLWFLGYPEQALLKSQSALTLARHQAEPFDLGFALIFAAGLHQFRREGPITQEHAEAGIALAREHGFTALLSAGTIRRGWALAEQGHAEEGLQYMQQGLTSRQATGAELAQPYFLALQAEVYGHLGQGDRALTLLSEALAAMHASGEHRLEAELHRLKGELTLQQFKVQGSTHKVENPQSAFPDPQLAAEACFLKALDVARRQQAKSLELRAAVSLVRLRRYQAQDRAPHNTQPETPATRRERRAMLDEALTVLSEIYNWFTEGFDTKDLREAKALLTEAPTVST
jgi:class 3 adenylate cyclase/predicted ATPase